MINDCCTVKFEGSQSATLLKVQRAILYLNIQTFITNCTFSNNTGGGYSAVIAIDCSNHDTICSTITNSSISDNNNLTGISITNSVVHFKGCNVIQNNKGTNGAGITLRSTDYIEVQGELRLYNNTADGRGGAILVKKPLFKSQEALSLCTINFYDSSSKLFFSGNRAGKGGSDMYGAILMGCDNVGSVVSHIGQSNETSWYFDTPLMKHLHFSNTDRLSSMSSDPIMVCFCNNSNLPDCSDRSHHIQTYPGLEINTSIATV